MKPAKKDVTITARLIIGQDEWVRVLHPSEWHKTVWGIFPVTGNQIASEQYIKQLGFVRKTDENRR